MAPEPFLTVPIRRGRDWLHVRFRARQIAQLLRFPPADIACITAGAFFVAQQASQHVGRCDVCFAIRERRLHVFARPCRRLLEESGSLYCLQKPLPKDDQQLTGEDAAWLIRHMQQLAPFRMADEVVRQNQEVLELLSQLRAGQHSSLPNVNPSAA